ncbi:beta-phosphoglucomutase family hydrolase [Cryobacterium sp. 1639]|uniref:beta-phosphoglucomutase family hydrolase n=1 Tax=Cryobacterium inferilacus TaxID=2866629 RepID=UPI001C72D598|nr:beta-phosphoglucomutase family hydrolase [Cryobacterium sp. 1639]MBX0300489.1 beta-phosphoglucomutase family hydrolase [Cryobacterium sp. 1639]
MHLDNFPLGFGKVPASFGAMIFDMDGVVTDTATAHAAAWKTLFDELLSSRVPPQRPFDAVSDYRAHVDGRPRVDGIRNFLASRGINVPEGTPDDSPEVQSVHGLAVRKQELFDEELRRGITVFPDAARLLQRLHHQGTPVALVTSSRNSSEVLERAGVLQFFATRVDGLDAVRLHLPGKPDPATFLEAAYRLGVAPARIVVFEGAQDGVAAAVDGGFGLVVGVDRGHNRDHLLQAGAHQVVTDVDTIDLTASMAPGAGPEGAFPGWCGGAAADANRWLLRYDSFDPAHEGTREALCAMGNGYWATRGAYPGTSIDGVHYPGTYLAGVFNRLTTTREGHSSETESLVNAPDWAFLQVRIGNGEPLLPQGVGLLSYTQQLDLRRGILTRATRFQDATGRITRIGTEQFQSLVQPHLAALRMTVEAENWSGDIQVQSSIAGRVRNGNVAADTRLATEHLTVVDTTHLDEETVLLEARTNQSGISIAMAARTRLADVTEEAVTRLPTADHSESIGHDITVRLRQGTAITIDKVVAVTTSRDRALSTAGLDATSRIQRAEPFEVLRTEHQGRWKEMWDRFGIELQAGHRQSLALNLHIFHVLQTVSAANPDLDAGVPARGLHGEGYRGHIFWDEIFVYPLLTLRRPALTRALLMYRYRRLDAARAAAREAGLSGAMFPWQSGSDGREETPTELFNTRNQQWMADNSRRQLHVGLGIAYSTWQYYQTTKDLEFLTSVGAEIIIEVARLFASVATKKPEDDRFSINGVMGPDEFHDGYPAAAGQGVRNNTYTNVMASWVFARAIEVVDTLAAHDLAALGHRLALTDDEPVLWNSISRNLTIPFHADGVISQFEGYETLREFEWDAYRRRYSNIGRLDLILQAEGDATNNYRLSKQADVLMLFYLFSAEELRKVFTRLGYALPPDSIPRTVQFYLARTSHGSTLSRLVHSWVLARSDRPQSWPLFSQALEGDLSDAQGGTTQEGIHLGAMAGTADMVVRCYAGVETRDDMLRIHPVLPRELPAASFQIRYRDQPVDIEITQTRLRLRLHDCSATPIRVCVEDVQRVMKPGETWQVPLLTTAAEGQPSIGTQLHTPVVQP